ncbi:neprilysin-like isoform X2 [Haliotis cracherodii]|uniref:neprilysin-like isoform X2 n=1 Tax=Haliotis cracherodii TaxID=6455 RepID=UPI0039EAF343
MMYDTPKEDAPAEERIELLPTTGQDSMAASVNGSPQFPPPQMNGQVNYVTAEEGGTQVAYAGPPQKSGKWKPTWLGGWTRMEVLFLILSLCLAIIIVVLIVVIVATNGYDSTSSGRSGNLSPQSAKHKKWRYTPQAKGVGPDGRPSDSAQKGDQVQEPMIPPDLTMDDLCLTTDCVKASSRLINAMDASADPCEDFFQYACGNWNNINVIPDDRATFNTFSKLRDEIQVMLKGLLEEPVTDKDSAATRKAKYLYDSCVNETQIDIQGLGPVKQLLAELGGWPVVLDSEWKEEDHDMLDLILKLRLYNNKVLIDQWISADDKNSKVNIIQLDQPDLGMPSRDYYLKGRDDSSVLAYEKYARDVAIMFGANETIAESDISKIIDFETELANITIPQDQRRDNEQLYNRMTIAELQRRVPGFDWLRYLSVIFGHVNIAIDAVEEVVVYAPDYLENMVKILHRWDKRVIFNYLVWRIMMNRVTNLPDKYRNVRKDYYKKILGSETERARWRDCATYVNDNMGNAVGRLFVEKHFDEDAKSIALEMIHNIRYSFYHVLEAADWMDETTRVVAREKADAIAEKIGYPEFILNDTALDLEYVDVEFYKDRYFENVMANIKSRALTNIKKLREPVDKSQWSTTPVVVNAFYSSTKNQIMIPAGILQPPFYSKGYPKSLNYGGIGMVIGHEITHGFDDRGRQFDKDGNLIQWWDDHVIEKFKERAQCIIKQYGNFTVPEVNMKVNGVQTQGENIADNGGLKEAYTAYRKWAVAQPKEEKRLPGLAHLDHFQLFFLNFAQVWCGSMRPEAAINRIRTGVHSPGRFRVIGTLQNSNSFTEAFGCPLNSKMNPPHKCTVW